MSKLLLLAGAVLFAFGAWGCWTKAGQRQFDEMAGILPFAALWAGGGLFTLGVALRLWRR
jgi:hypothetical protein